LARYMCAHPDSQCRFAYHGVPVRPDGTHYTGPGASAVAEWILAQMRIAR
jgi:hypothetical protein